MTESNKLIVLGKSQWTIIAIGVIVLPAAILCSIFWQDVDDAYFRTFVGPQLEREFGFKSGSTDMQLYGLPYKVFTITSVESGGILKRSGVMNDDIPIKIFHRKDAEFFRDLIRARSEPLTIEVINATEYSRWIEFNQSKIWDLTRKCRISTVRAK